MRRLALSVFASVVVLVLPAPALADHVGPLAGQWRLDQSTPLTDGCCAATTPDSSGHGLTATALGGTFLQPGGKFGNYRTPAGTQVVTVDPTPLTRPNRLTLLAWVRRSGAPPQLRYIAGQGDDGFACSASSYAMYTGVGATAGLNFYIRRPTGFAASSPNAGTALWDGNWHLVAGVYDGQAVRLYVDGRQVGNGTPAPNVPIDYNIPGSNFYFDGYPIAACGNGDFPGDLDEVRLYRRALSATELRRLAAAPGPNPPVLIPDGTGGPGGPGGSAPRVAALTPARPLAANSAAVLNARTAGAVTRLEWNLRGSSAPEIISGPNQTAVRFRPRPGPFTVEVTPVGPGGRGPPLSQSFVQPSQRLGGIAATIDKRARNLGSVYASGDSSVIGVLKNPSKLCALVNTVIRAGALEIEGCLRPITSLENIPAGERGILDPLAAALSLSGGRDSQFGIRTIGPMLDLTDGYIANGAVTVNGVRFSPQGNAVVLVYPQANRVVSSDARMSIGNLKLDNPRRFALNTAIRGGQIPLGEFPRIAGSLPKIAGFNLVGNVKVNLLPAGNAPAEARITASLKLPEFLKIGGVDFQSRVELRATAAQGLIIDNLTIGPLNADIGALAVEDFRIDYTRATAEWRGKGKACVVSGACLDMVPPNGRVVITNGQLNFAGASLVFPPPGIPLFPGVALDRIGFGFGLDPTRLTGNAAVTALKIYAIDGRLLLAFPSEAAPYIFDRDEVGGGFPAGFYGRAHTRATIGISADASLKVPVAGNIRLGNGYFLYEYPGYVAFGGGVRQGIAGVIEFTGGFAGEFNASNGRFNLSGSVNACVVDIFCRGVFGLISSRGAAACLSLGPLNIGGGVRFSPFSVSLWPLDGCKWSPFAEQNVRGARAVQAGGPVLVRIERGDPSRAIRLDAASAAPRVRVSGPGGQSLESTPGPGFRTSGALRIMRSEQLKAVVVGLQDPRPGVYRIEQLPGSATPNKVTGAIDPPDARARVRLSGTGLKRVLSYDVRRRPKQRVTFVEEGADGSTKPIGTVAGGGRGKLRFTSAPGRGRRKILARFELNGLPAETLTVKRFRAPSARLAKPTRVRVRRSGTKLRVSWRGVSGAARYQVVATSSGGTQRLRTTKGRKTVLKGLPTSTGGRVTVRALDQLRSGRPARATYRRTTKLKTRFGPLARCKKTGQRLVCRAQR